jgi:hypothetical protein
MDCRTLGINCIETQQQFSNQKVPQHLTELFERTRNGLSDEQTLVVAKLLNDKEDLLMEPGVALGRTALVKHEIDTGDAKPVKQ